MMTTLVSLVALFFLGMGLFALAWPTRVVAFFGTSELTSDGRNEVRAVYGGFGVAVGVVLAIGLAEPSLSRGIFLAIGVALLGMASGRLVSWFIDRSAGPYPRLFFGVELALAAVLFAASRWQAV